MISINQLNAVLSRFSKREKIIFYASIVFVSLTLIDRLLISPALTKSASLEKEIAAQKMVIQEDLHFISLKNGINIEASGYAGYFSKDISPDEGMNKFLKLTEDFARRSSVNLLNIRPAGLKTEKNTVRYYVDLNCRGTMEMIMNFLYFIESAKKILTIEKLTLAPQEEGSLTAQCRLTISRLVIP